MVEEISTGIPDEDQEKLNRWGSWFHNSNQFNHTYVYGFYFRFIARKGFQLKQVREQLHFTGVKPEAQKVFDITESHGKLVTGLGLLANSSAKFLSTIWAPISQSLPVFFVPGIYYYELPVSYSPDVQLWIGLSWILQSPSVKQLFNKSVLGFTVPIHSTSCSVDRKAVLLGPEAKEKCVHLCTHIKISSQILNQKKTLMKAL